jgi:hypothetical protein
MENESEQQIVHVPKNGAALAPAIETAAAGVAAQMEAQIKARYTLAVMHPRDIDTVRGKILKACARPGFAVSARYRLPRKKKITNREGREEWVPIEGPSIRFAEEVARSYGNLSVESSIVHDDAERRVVRVTVTDVEANLPLSTDVVVEKFVERSKLREGQGAMSSRMNSAGKVVYRIEADEGEMVLKQAALTSKARRNLILQVLPADILEEAMDACLATTAKGDAEDPDAARKKLLDAFASVGVKPADLKAYVGHEVEHIDAATRQELRDLFVALKEGATTWPEVMEGRASDDKKAAAATAPKSLDELTKARKKAKEPAPDPEAPPPDHWEKTDKEGA